MKPILFNTEMVKAILDGRKTVTRRLVKLDLSDICPLVSIDDKPDPIGYLHYRVNSQYLGGVRSLKSPYKVGDILYVTETWKVDSINPRLNNMLIDFRALQQGYSQAEISADFEKIRFDKFRKFYQKNGWQSPYFMPKEAARIFLRVTDVRVEKLQDMKIIDIEKEGFSRGHGIDETWYDRGKKDFSELWNSTIKKSDLDRYGWDASPWVWVIEFERISKEEALQC